MRPILIRLALFALIVAFTEPALADRGGVPGRRVGGGTRMMMTDLPQLK